MPLDPLYLSAGLGALCMLLAAVAAVMQRRLSRQQAELSLLDERLSQAMLAQEGLGAQLETSRLEHAELQASRAALQAEAAVLRRETERPEAVAEGVVQLVGTDRTAIVEAASRLLRDPDAYAAMARGTSPYGDGHAAGRIAAILRANLAPGA